MKNRVCLLFISIYCIIIFTGCNIILGGTLLKIFGMEFTSQIEMLEECLSINLDDLTDDCIKTIYSESDPEGNNLCIQYISLEGKGAVISSQISDSEYWTELPYNSEIENLLAGSGVDEHYDFSCINEGSYIISGTSENSTCFHFDRQNMDTWITYEIGIWDPADETLYFISITNQ